MLAKVHSFIAWGIDAMPIDIEVDVSRGFPSVSLVGTVDTSVKESKERVKAAIKNSGFTWPAEKITISLIPADIKKVGAIFDVPIALGVLAASSQINPSVLEGFCVLGELSLDGSLQASPGVLPISLALAKSTIRKLIIPAHNAPVASLSREIEVFPVHTLFEAAAFLKDPSLIKPWVLDENDYFTSAEKYPYDFSEVKGQPYAKRALEVAVAGGHNILMIGPPGSGKSMLAKRIPSIMPDLTREESLELTKIYSAAHKMLGPRGIVRTRPFRAPHHGTSSVALIGGGPDARPGEISLAHLGVLFLDELPELPRDCLEGLRQPLEDGCACVSRTSRTVTYPASCTLVAAMNPCPCGNYTDPKKVCHCGTHKIRNYVSKISGPLLDRLDIHIEMSAVQYKDLTNTETHEGSELIKARIQEARLMQRQRLAQENIFCNAHMNVTQVKKYCALDEEAAALLKMAMTELGLSARAYGKILKVGRTIADLANSQEIRAHHITEAIQYRCLDRQW